MESDWEWLLRIVYSYTPWVVTVILAYDFGYLAGFYTAYRTARREYIEKGEVSNWEGEEWRNEEKG